ncbi:non-homologous end-joining factor 1-like [Mizuhopecten yessoensis]|uniref:Non-homologous end-joining factor 1 n=1 Tax=Mizuhopecten yessoensis TaxID=6573 RepID=A0A210PFQ4_MIZYE|nr:non-homologous end-joining factor 1-like [Mizuhopecten yessoensis]OWF35318.1 Non-homologous end-joining factor 1 [Mizuhopecten yessoensis]
MSTEIDWRRRWKPDLSSCPWQPIEVDGIKYLIKFRFTEDSYEILITDLVHFWYEELEDMALRKRIQKLNPSIEASLTRILDQIRSSIECPERETTLSVGFKSSSDDDQEKIMLKITSQLAGMPFAWNFIASVADGEMVSENLIIPLMGMVSELARRQKELVKVIENKDKEIDDYKTQGVKTSRKHIETKRFVETAFENEMLMAKTFESSVKALGSTAFEEAGQDLYRQIMTKHAWINRSPTKKEDNNDEFDDTSLGDAAERKGSSGPSWGSSRLPPSITGPKSVSPDKVRPKTSPAKSPKSSASNTPEGSPVKDSEYLRRQALERRLEQEEMKKHEKTKKKKKIAF